MMPALFNHVWQSTLFAAAAALLTVAFRRNRAQLRYGLWFVASVKFLVPFAALASIGSLLESKQALVPIVSVMTSPAIRGFNAPFAELSLGAAPLAASARTIDWIAPSLFAVWLCGVVVIAIRRVNEWRRIRAAVRFSTPWDGRTNASAKIQVRTVPTMQEPGVVGLFHPVVFLPAGIDTYLTADQLAAVISHEVCHAHRRDNLTAAVHMLVEAVFWFHPMVWWIGARLIAEREHACDEHVIAVTGEPLAYAEGIVTVCRRYLETPLMSVAGVGGADIKARIESILSNRIGARLTLPKRLVLATAALVSLVVPIAAGAIDAAAGQLPGVTPAGPPIDPETRFEVVSIKPFDASAGASPRISTRPGRYEQAGMPLRLLVGEGLGGVPLGRIVGLPAWIDTERYTILAKAPDGPVPNATALAIMTANLLKDRFKMATHTETREMAVFNLVFARDDKRRGPGLKETSAECRAKIADEARHVGTVQASELNECVKLLMNPGVARFSGVQMAFMTNFLTQSVGRPVIDKTGLTGVYDFSLTWTPEVGGGDPDTPSLFTAVQEQLGLKLESARGPVEVIVVDRFEKPTFD